MKIDYTSVYEEGSRYLRGVYKYHIVLASWLLISPIKYLVDYTLFDLGLIYTKPTHIWVHVVYVVRARIIYDCRIYNFFIDTKKNNTMHLINAFQL